MGKNKEKKNNFQEKNNQADNVNTEFAEEFEQKAEQKQKQKKKQISTWGFAWFMRISFFCLKMIIVINKIMMTGEEIEYAKSNHCFC